MPLNNCINRCFVVMLFISIILTQISETHSTCAQTQCNRNQCPNPTECVYGMTDDDCHCCQVCIRYSGQSCGPYIGKCAKGLKCLSGQHLDPIITNLVANDKPIGVCGPLNCTGVKCDNTSANDHIKCQNDSYKLLSTGSDSCCQTTCVCLPGICKTSVAKCPKHMIAQVVRAGDGKPGTCCDQIECIRAPTKCIQNNNQYSNGDKWKSELCSECECRDGITFCKKIECKAITDCTAVDVVDDQCCPTCQGCISSTNGKYFNNSHDWYENDCTHCQCINGKPICKVQMCSPVHCDNPITVSGQCCPICPTQSTRCDVECLHGYKRNAFGNEICECIDCFNKTFECKMFCPFGFKRGSDGCAICQCLTVPNNLIPEQTIHEKEGNSCNLSNGSLVANGLYWHDSCRECFCTNGKIMCTKPNCPPIKCSNTIILNNQCCPICATDQNKAMDQTNGVNNGNHIHSHLFITAIILTLIITILLLGIFILLAVFIVKKYPNIRYTRNRVINGSMSENAIIHLWPYSTTSAQVPKVQEKQFISIRVGNKNDLLNDNSLEIEDLGHSLEDKLLTSCSSPD